MKILLVEDDPSLAEVLAEAMATQRYTVDTASDGEAAWEQASNFEYDLVVLDVMLPKLDGFGFCQRVRTKGYRMPILMVTARDTSTDKVIGLDAGADDYMIKPVDIPEFLARIRALLRRGSTSTPPILEWGELHLNPATYEVTYSKQKLRLTPKEYSLLELFLRHGKQIMSRSAIIEHLWSFDKLPREETVKVHIKTLRQKLKLIGAPDDFIETVHGVGYRLKPLQGK
ncbi:MAG TPA: DNA-binding response regulator [Cyanobacteria bacterium UBA11149]|nr:DNA-binding response regulator [Cyanobacteria bacterium UBA11366]HBK63662.1 DNA-binding response regulator [Cyanobacteria bacterium UBA11166]HBR77160.1 DNA-binding response regulator [Cyanobacteria bacterium UBA11159]HBS68647.1 DNA-binding response regulator [Cyanobacteria bacterium UBA11153]HBW91327.1 DNA-binding response regulator [Cyanobacteria bacterium UBA11149]HCA93637.1 DNA-binding response regulator [Cyanobacteria bacterium UBA9226]